MTGVAEGLQAGPGGRRQVNRVVIASAIVLVCLAPWLVNTFTLSLLTFIGIYALATLGLVLLTGIGGVTSFGQAAFMGVGAYATAYVTLRLGLPPWLGLGAALLVTALLALVMGYATLHLGGHYLAITTIAWAVAIQIILGNITELGAHSGVGDIPPVSLFGRRLVSASDAFYLTWAFVGVALLAAANLIDSRQGRAIRTLRGGEAVTASLGINAFRERLTLFVLAAELGCVAGWLFAHTQNFISPSVFDLNASLNVLLMSVLGGAHSVVGAVVGAAVVMLGRNSIQDFLQMFSLSGGYETIVFGVLFIAVIQWSPRGLSPLFERFLPSGRDLLPPEPASTDRAVASSRLELLRDAGASGGNILEVRNLTRRFGGLVAVSDLSFDVKQGEILALIGPNGAGKSTTFNIISGLTLPSGGTVKFLNKQITGTPPHRLISQGLARTFQHVKLRPKMSLLENVMLGAHWRMTASYLTGALRLGGNEEMSYRRLALRCLDEVGLREAPLSLAGNLPLGQQRLLEIARALASDPVMILLDEPAAGLRSQEKAALAELLRKLRANGVTILLVEHDMDFVMGLADSVVVLDFGQFLASGTPAQIRGNARVQEAYLGGVV